MKSGGILAHPLVIFFAKKQSQIRLLLFGKLRIICGYLFFFTEVIGYYRKL
jgi:hypothetical protein